MTIDIVPLLRGRDRIELRSSDELAIVEHRAEPWLSRPRTAREENAAQAYYDRIRACWEMILAGWPSEYVRSLWLHGQDAIA